MMILFNGRVLLLVLGRVRNADGRSYLKETIYRGRLGKRPKCINLPV